MTQTKVQYYYHLEEYRQGKVPLGLFNLKDISEIKKLNDYSYGNKKYLFMVSVTRWIKKEKPQKKRSYIFSVKNMEDLYSWLISLNFMRFNAYYETYAVSFGKVDLPLYGFGNEKKKKFLFDIENKEIPVSFRQTRINKNKFVVLVLKNNNQIDINVKVYDKYLITKKLIRSGLLNILGAIQQGITKNKDNHINNNQILMNNMNNAENNDIEEEIKIPQHLSLFQNNARKNSIISSESGDTMTIISQLYSKRQRKKSLALINEDEEDIKKERNNKEESEESENSSLKDSEQLFYVKKTKRKRNNEESSDKESEKSEKTGKDTEKIFGDKSYSEISRKDQKERNANINDDDIYITDEENDIEDEENLIEKNHKIKLMNDFRNNINKMNNFDYDDEEEYKNDIINKNKLISSFNNSEDSNYDIISKDNDLNSDKTKKPKFFFKERNIRDFLKISERNTMTNESKNNSYE